VVVTDFIQFILDGGCIVFAFFAVDHVGDVVAPERLAAGHAGEQI
jgi:hypothetical protein